MRAGPSDHPASHAAAALLVYLAAAVLLLGLPVLRHPDASYIGLGNDAEIFIWAFRWWPWALAHGHDPLHASAIFAPQGLDLAWTATVPGLAFLLSPVTVVAGAVATYNAAAVAAPALGAFCAYLLCREVVGGFWPSLAGGWVFGFSSYVLGQSLGHLHVALVPLLPLAALLAARRAAGRTRPRRFVVLLGVLVGAQVWLSTEVAFTLVLAFAGGLAVALWAAPASRAVTRAMAREAAAALGVGLLLGSPLLVRALWHFEPGSLNHPNQFPLDVLNLVVPTPLTRLGGTALDGLSSRFRGNVAENGGYIGLPLLAVVALYARQAWRTPRGRLLLALLAVALLAALGPLLRVAGVAVAPLPWLLVVFLPVFDNVLPVRLAAYAWLALAVIVACWLREGRAPAPLRAGLVALGLAAIFPSVGSALWHADVPVPAFFAQDQDRRVLARGEIVVVLPYANRGHGMLWQAESGLWFRMAGGYVTPDPPASFRRYPAVQQLLAGAPGPDAVAAFRRFLADHRVAHVVADPAEVPVWGPVLDALGPATRVGGVVVWRVGSSRAGS